MLGVEAKPNDGTDHFKSDATDQGMDLSRSCLVIITLLGCCLLPAFSTALAIGQQIVFIYSSVSILPHHCNNILFMKYIGNILPAFALILLRFAAERSNK